MSSGSPGTSTVRNETVVDPITQQWRNALFSEAGSLYNQGAPAYYPGSQVTPYADQTWQGLDMLEQQAQGGAPNYQAAVDASGKALQGSAANPAMGYAKQFADGTSTGQQAMASFLPGAENPYLDQLYQRGAEKVTDQVNAQFAGAGRYGANAAYGEGLSEGLGSLYSSIYAPAYESERNRQQQAAQAMTESQMAGAGMMGDTYSQGNTDAMRAMGLLPSIYDYGAQPAQSMIGVGGAYEALGNEYLQEDINRYNYAQNAPWDYLARYSGIVNGLPDFSGGAQSSQGPKANRAMGALGGAMSGASIGSQISPGWGTAIGAVGGALTSLYG